MQVFEKSTLTCLQCGQFSNHDEFCCRACQVLYSDPKKIKLSGLSKFDYYNSEQVSSHYINPKTNEIRFHINGLQCSSCVHLLEKIPKFFEDCESSQVLFGQSLLLITLKNSRSLGQLMELIVQLGYEPTPLKWAGHNKSQKDSPNSDLKRIAVAGVCAAQIMAFSFALYGGVDGLLKDVFRWSSLLLFLPLLFYSALPFYKGAWNSLRFKMIHIDLPIVIALWMSSAFSFWHFYQGKDEFYFDSTAGFIFLILSARLFIKKTQTQFLSPEHVRKHFSHQIFQLANGNYKLAENILPGEQIVVKSGQIVPIDCELLSESAIVDTSMMNGESRPHYFARNLKILAGFKLVSQEALVLADKDLNSSELSILIKESFNNLLTKSQFITKSDRLARKLLLTVLLVSAVFFVGFGSFFGFEEALKRVLALIVVACPCALAFGSPLTLAMAFKKAHRLGIAIRNPDVFEKISRVKNIFFDKTGTLTEGHLKLDHTWPDTLSLTTKKLILSLEKISIHPVAFALRNAWSSDFTELQNSSLKLKSHIEKLGIGLSAEYENSNYELRGLPDSLHSSAMAITLLKDKEPMARIYFEDPIRIESKKLIEFLKNKKIECFILSGDRFARSQFVGKMCGIESKNIFSELYPEDKESIIMNHQDTLMIGDGLNDTLALSKSDVGISMSTAHELTVTTSDVTFLRGGLQPLIDLFVLQSQTTKTLNRNLFLALVYNVVAGAFALSGAINPLAAALLMPLSTGIVLLSCFLGFKESQIPKELN